MTEASFLERPGSLGINTNELARMVNEGLGAMVNKIQRLGARGIKETGEGLKQTGSLIERTIGNLTKLADADEGMAVVTLAGALQQSFPGVSAEAMEIFAQEAVARRREPMECPDSESAAVMSMVFASGGTAAPSLPDSNLVDPELGGGPPILPPRPPKRSVDKLLKRGPVEFFHSQEWRDLLKWTGGGCLKVGIGAILVGGLYFGATTGFFPRAYNWIGGKITGVGAWVFGGVVPGAKERQEAQELSVPENAYREIKMQAENLVKGEQDPEYFFRHFVPYDSQKSVVENPEQWTPEMKAWAKALQEVAADKNITDTDLAKNIYANLKGHGKDDPQGAVLLEIIELMGKEKKPMATYDPLIQKLLGDNGVTVLGVLKEYYKKAAGEDWPAETGMAEPWVFEVAQELPQETTLSNAVATRYAISVLGGEGGYLAGAKLGRELQRAQYLRERRLAQNNPRSGRV